MPKQVKARVAQDEREERAVRKLARSQHAPADWIWHARMVVESWAGKTPDQIAAELHSHPQTVRIHVVRFTQQGIDGLGVQPGSGRKPRLTEAERSVIVALPSQSPPGRLVTQRDGTMVARDESGSAQWSLDALALAAKEAGIRVKRSQIRRILLKEGVRWRQTHSWGTPRDKDFVPKERRSSPTTPSHQRDRRPSAQMNWDRSFPAPLTRPPFWSPDGHRMKAPMDYERGPEKTWVYGALRVRDGKELTLCAASRNSKGYIALLADIEADNPTGDIFIITDNLSSHSSLETRTWLEEHPRLHHLFIPTGACWLNLQEGWWRLFRRDALAGQSFANPTEIEQATRVATAQLNLRAKPWVWGRLAIVVASFPIAFEECSTR